MSFKFVPFPLCYGNTGFLHSLCFLHFLSSLCPRCVLAHPPCLHWVVPSQPSHITLSIIFSEKRLLAATPFPPPVLLHPTPAFQRAVIALIAPHACFQCALHNGTFTFVHVITQFISLFARQTADYVRAGKYLFLLTIVCSLSSPGPGNSRLSLCGIVRYMGHLSTWVNGWISTAALL